jgi:hypothetical protein
MTLALAVAFCLQAGRPAPPPGKWSFDGRLEGEVRYDSNIWLLNDSQESRLEDDLASDQASGRFDDMETVDDFILRPEVRAGLKGPSPLGRKVDLWAGLAWEQYLQNSARSHLEAGLGLGQSVGSRGRLEVRFGFVPGYFKKNYLADGVDANGNGNISSSERVYEPGDYREWEATIGYRHDLVERGPQDAFGMDARVLLGFRDRSFDSPFSVRDEEALWIRLGLGFEHLLRGAAKSKGTRVRWGVYYEYKTVDDPADPEVVLLDEAAFGVDFSGDGDSTDPNARVVTPVDRSRVEHAVGLGVEVEVTSSLDAGIAYEHVIKDFSSDEALDVSHTDREDTRDEVTLYVRADLGKSWDGRLSYGWREQETDRPDSPSTDTTDYTRHVFALSVIYRW